MGVLTCPACGHKVSEHADCCPDCGCKIEYIKKAPINKDLVDKTGYYEGAIKGEPEAMAAYSQCLEFGDNCDKNLEQAFFWAKKAYEKNNPLGCYQYAHLIWNDGCREQKIGNAENLKNAIKAALKGAELNNAASISFLAETFHKSYYFSNPFLAGYYFMMLKTLPFTEYEDLEEDREEWELDDFSLCEKVLKEELETIYEKIDSCCAIGGDYSRAKDFAKSTLKLEVGAYGNSYSLNFGKMLNELKKLEKSYLTEKFLKYLLGDLIVSKKISFDHIDFNLEKSPEEKLLDKILYKPNYIQTDEEAFEILRKIVTNVNANKYLNKLELDYKYSIPFMGKDSKSTHIYALLQKAKEAVNSNNLDFFRTLSRKEIEVLGRYSQDENY